ncbi:MAG: hypothetical protein M0R75_07075, partial [Dehalococcoidia bacterium]|nr:hypothetical protein [Dehalococcoidia bacterium]
MATTEQVQEQAEPTHEQRMAEAGAQFTALLEALPAGVTFSDLILASDLIGYERVGGRYNEQRDLRPVERTLNLRKSRIYTRWNPLVDRAVGLWTEMAFEEPWTFTAKDPAFQKVIDEFQTFKRNRSVLSWIAAQGLSRDLLTDGEIPFVYFVGDDGVQVRAMDPIEFLDPVTNPNDKAEVWYWPRSWVGSDGKRHLWLYRDWNAVSDDGTPINQPVPEADRQRLQVSGAMAEVELTARPNEYV